MPQKPANVIVYLQRSSSGDTVALQSLQTVGSGATGKGTCCGAGGAGSGLWDAGGRPATSAVQDTLLQAKAAHARPNVVYSTCPLSSNHVGTGMLRSTHFSETAHATSGHLGCILTLELKLCKATAEKQLRRPQLASAEFAGPHAKQSHSHLHLHCWAHSQFYTHSMQHHGGHAGHAGACKAGPLQKLVASSPRPP